ncbi:MAG: hypothetical protein L0K86_16375 [Actinomycetia bacterium]|nr:hypothetical protein [Actinomycetes bacterium]
MTAERDIARVVVAQWQAAGPALAQVHRQELGELTDAEALDAALALLDLVADLPPKVGSSGLVEQQRYFARAPR